MIFPYLSLTAPETQGNHQMSGSLPDPWAVLPLRGSHRAVLRRKSHYAVMDLGLCTGSCPALTGQLPLWSFGPSSRWLLM